MEINECLEQCGEKRKKNKTKHMNQSNDIIRHIKVSSDLVVNGLKTCRITGDSLSATWRMFEGHLSQSQEANRSDDKGTFD